MHIAYTNKLNRSPSETIWQWRRPVWKLNSNKMDIS